MTNPLHELPPGATITYIDHEGVERTFDPNPRLKVGQRFRSRDSRDHGRVVEITAVIGIDQKSTWEAIDWILFGRRPAGSVRSRTASGPSRFGKGSAQRAEYVRQRGTRYWVQNVATGRTVRMQENTLRDRFDRLP